MRVTCPHCQKPITVPDSSAEQPTPCPECGKTFTAPAVLSVPITAPAPPPEVYGVTPPPTRPAAAPAPPPPPPEPRPAPADVPASAASANGFRFAVTQQAARWVGPLALLVLFAMTFFTWVTARHAGLDVYAQSAWQVLSGGFTTDVVGEEVFAREKDLQVQSGWSPFMALTLLVLVAALPLALMDLFEEYVTVWIPDVLQRLWPYRLSVLTGMSFALFVLISLQLMWGVGLEQAAYAAAEARLPAPTGDAAEGTRERQVRKLRQAEEVSRLGVRRTWILGLAFAASAVAAVGFALDLSLTRRRGRPYPVVEVSW